MTEAHPQAPIPEARASPVGACLADNTCPENLCCSHFGYYGGSNSSYCGFGSVGGPRINCGFNLQVVNALLPLLLNSQEDLPEHSVLPANSVRLHISSAQPFHPFRNHGNAMTSCCCKTLNCRRPRRWVILPRELTIFDLSTTVCKLLPAFHIVMIL